MYHVIVRAQYTVSRPVLLQLGWLVLGKYAFDDFPIAVAYLYRCVRVYVRVCTRVMLTS